MTFRVRFWGVRGSLPTPGTRTVRFGGNTSCVEVRAGERVLILDSGTGIVGLGKSLEPRRAQEVDFLMSHLHWDHIQGFPFFDPAFRRDALLRIHGNTKFAESFEEAFAAQMGGAYHPVPFRSLPARIEFVNVGHGEKLDLDAQVAVTMADLDHPGGSIGYRIEHGGRSVVYATDHEHFTFVDPNLIALARGADVLIYDAMYTDDEYLGNVGFHRVGWGHSTWQYAARTAIEAGVKQLVLFHHDPAHDDACLEAIERLAQQRFPRTTVAWEGLEIDLDA